MPVLVDLLIGLPENSFQEVVERHVEQLKSRTNDQQQLDQVKLVTDGLQPLYILFNDTFEKLRTAVNKSKDLQISETFLSRTVENVSIYKNTVGKILSMDVGKMALDQTIRTFRSELERVKADYLNQGKNKGVIDYTLQAIDHIKLKLSSHEIDSSNLNVVEEMIQFAELNSPKLQSAIEIADSMLEARESNLGQDIQFKIDDFNTRAQKHNEKGIWLWLFLSILLGGIAIWILKDITNNISDSVSFGKSLLNLSLISIIIYFSFFCIKQFNIHRHLYQSYIFKSISLHLMQSLRGEMDEIEKKVTLIQALETIFSPPDTGLSNSTKTKKINYEQSIQKLLEQVIAKDVNNPF